GVVPLLPSTTEAGPIESEGCPETCGVAKETKVVLKVPVSKKVTPLRLLFSCATWPDHEPTATVPSLATSMSSGLLNELGAPVTLFRLTLLIRTPLVSKRETTEFQAAV